MLDCENSHYNAIRDLKKIMCSRGICYKCMTAFTCKKAHDNHKCEPDITRGRHSSDHDDATPDELSHYMHRCVLKGSEEMRMKHELAEEKGTEWEGEQGIRCPRYIIFDFETDTHTGIHMPSHVEVAVLEVDPCETPDYEKCLKKPELQRLRLHREVLRLATDQAEQEQHGHGTQRLGLR